MNTQDERKAFEERFQHLDLDFVEDVGYCESETQYAWAAWWEATKRAQEKLEGCVVVPVKSCKWTKDEDSNWWTECGEGFVFNEDPHPHNHNFKNCCFCGGLLEAARGGNEH